MIVPTAIWPAAPSYPTDQSAASPPEQATLTTPAEEPAPRHAPPARDPMVSVSRATLYSIAGLIVATSLLSFLLGFLMGRFSPSADSSRIANTPRRLTGRLTYATRSGMVAADSDAVVIVLPVGREPDEKLEPLAVRPEASRPDAQHPTVLGIRSIGGDVTRTRPNGDFALEVPRAGEYFVLLLSGNLQRSADEPPTTMQIAQIARYFKPADMLLGNNAFRWTKEWIQEDRHMDYRFIER